MNEIKETIAYLIPSGGRGVSGGGGVAVLVCGSGVAAVDGKEMFENKH